MGCGSSKEGDLPISAANPNTMNTMDRETGKTKGPKLTKKKNAKSKDTIILSDPSHSQQIIETAAVTFMGESSIKTPHHLKNVFVAPLGDLENFRAPIYEKQGREKKFIQKALEGNFVFAALTQKELNMMIDAFEKKQVQKGDTVIKQGDIGDYFYVLRDGEVEFKLNGLKVGRAGKGKTFGELALLYTSPRAASVIATTETTLYRVDQKTFRYIMQSQTLEAENKKRNLLKAITFLDGLDPSDLNKLVHAMTPLKFSAGDYLVLKGDEGESFFVIQEGTVTVKNITIGSTDYEDTILGPGDYFGERALISREPRTADCIAESDGVALTIDKETFEKVVGQFSFLVKKANDKRKLAALKIFANSKLSQQTLTALASSVTEWEYKPGYKIITEGTNTQAALYFVREGKVRITNSDSNSDKIIDEGGHFGDEMMELDVGGLKKTSVCVARYSVSALSEGVVLAVLPLTECRKYLDTTSLQRISTKDIGSSRIELKDLERHTILGAGTFGQVWLVTNSTGIGKSNFGPYALKIQTKFELLQSHQAKGVIQEKNLLEFMHHPFVINLVETYQDTSHLYMLLGLVQGGELFSLLHHDDYDGISEIDSRFYSAAVLEGLSHIHRKNVIYRDLKAENVLIDSQGYPVIVDFGFAKYVPEKTYTFCGTPLYLAPEVILNRGHNKAADHWSFGVLTFEMIAGYTPFYDHGIDQITLFRRICQGHYRFPPAGVMSMEVEDLLQRFFVIDPSNRLGSLARGIDEIYSHLWYDSIDFDALRHKDLTAPWVPKIKDPLDRSNFNSWDHLNDKTKQTHPPLTAEQQKIFEEY